MYMNDGNELQKNYYTDYIQAQPGWVFVGIYADEGISGTSLEHRKGMQQLIEDCKAGKIDLVLTKSIARFARNIVDCLSVIELLKNLNLLVPEIFHEGQRRKKNAADSQDNTAATKPVDSRKGFYPDDIVGTFGVPVEEHRKESEVQQMDGYVSMGILTGKIVPEAGKD